MSTLRSLALLAAAPVLAMSMAHADSDWVKSYPVSAKPSLSISTGDSSVDLHSCGACREISIRVEWRDYQPSNFNLTESQTGNHVEFSLHERAAWGFHMNFGNHHEPHVTIEVPQALDLEARTSDGALAINGVQGDLQLRTSDGSLDVSEVSGALRLTSSDGSIHVQDASGTLESHSSDGSVHISGKFSGVQVTGSDGTLDLTLEPGSRLTMASNVQTSDGSVRLHIARTLAADLEVHTSDGHLQCDLPLSMDGYNSSDTEKKGLRGKLNGGGVPLTIRTDDGSVSISAI